MKRLTGILLIILFAACNQVGVTETESSAVQSVLNFYGGLCHRKKGFSTKNGETQTYFELEMSKSELIENYARLPEMPASNIAYMFYSNLGAEKDNYTHVKVKINLADGSSFERSYPVADLEEMEKLTPVLQRVSNDIKTKDYEQLYSHFAPDTTSDPVTVEKLREYCFPFDSLYGDVKTTQFQGFTYFTSKKNNKPMALLAGIMLRQDESTPVSIIIDRKSHKLMSLKYDF